MASEDGFVLHIRASNVRSNVADHGSKERFPILAFVGTGALPTSPINSVPIKHLLSAPTTEMQVSFSLNPQYKRSAKKVPVAVMVQLHTHRLSDDGDLTKVNSAIGDRYIWLHDLNTTRHLRLTDLAFEDFCAITEDRNFHAMTPEIKRQHGPLSSLPWTTKAMLDLECWIEASLPPSIVSIVSPSLTSLDFFHNDLNKEVVSLAAKSVALTRSIPTHLHGLYNYDVQYYNTGADLLVPAAAMVANQVYTDDAAELMYERRMMEVLVARKIEPADFVSSMRAVLQKFEAYERLIYAVTPVSESPDTHLAPTDFQLECMNLIVESLLTMPSCSLPYTYDKSVVGTQEIDVERIDNTKQHRSVDCEDTSIEISMTHADIVMQRAAGRVSSSMWHRISCHSTSVS